MTIWKGKIDNKGDDNMRFKQFSTQPLTNEEMTREAGAPCYGYGTGLSHKKDIESAGGEIGYDGFRDPRSGHYGPIYADREFINQKTNQIQGINFRDAQGNFCCSYVGYNYEQIKEYNKDDLENKRKEELSTTQKSEQRVECDNYGVVLEKNQNSHTQGNSGYSGGVKR